MAISLYGCVGFLSRMILIKFVQQRCHSRVNIDVTKQNLKYSKKYSKIFVGPRKVRVNENSLLINIDVISLISM